MKKKQKQAIILGAAVTVIVALAALYSYTLEQTRMRGFAFGNELEQIQDDLKSIHDEFESKKTIMAEGDITREELAEFALDHIQSLQNIASRYDSLDVPRQFISSVELFRLSVESQEDSTREFILYLETGDEEHRIRSGELFQESFEYEITALSHFNTAKSGRDIIP